MSAWLAPLLLGKTQREANAGSGRGSGEFTPRENLQGKSSLGVYADRDAPLRPSTTYVVSVAARSRGGATLAGGRVIEQMIVEEGWIIALDKAGLAGQFEQRIDFDPRTITDLQIIQVV